MDSTGRTSVPIILLAGPSLLAFAGSLFLLLWGYEVIRFRRSSPQLSPSMSVLKRDTRDIALRLATLDQRIRAFRLRAPRRAVPSEESVSQLLFPIELILTRAKDDRAVLPHLIVKADRVNGYRQRLYDVLYSATHYRSVIMDPNSTPSDRVSAFSGLNALPNPGAFLTPDIQRMWLYDLQRTANDSEYLSLIYAMPHSCGNAEILSELLTAFCDSGLAQIRNAAIWPLRAELDDPNVAAAVERAAMLDPSPMVRSSAARAMRDWTRQENDHRKEKSQ